uniref:Plexin-A4 n=1 Tax=Schizaphis graminum TaxID=13262 RepID=A0A2S2N854_SCHGA
MAGNLSSAEFEEQNLMQLSPMRKLKNMVNVQRPGKNRVHWNHKTSINGLIMVLFVMCAAISCAYPTYIAETNNTRRINNCSVLKTCQKCVERGSCVWSLERQACFADYGMTLSLAVRTNTDCPRVTVVTKATYATHLPYVYKVKVSNDVTGFVAFLKQTQVSCVMLDVTRPAEMSGDTINCAPVNKSDLGFDHQTLMTYHCYVMFGEGDTILRMDDGTDSFFTVYDEFYYGYRPDEGCVSCLWDVGQYAYYFKWCPSWNTVTGRYKYYVGYSDIDRNAVMPAIDRLSATVPASSGCKDVRILSVEPLSALWTGGVRVNVTVNNHVMLADGGGEVKVTVAGRECVQPTLLDRGIGVTCELAIAGPGYRRPRSNLTGPVLITYGPSSLTVESAQTFQLVYPEITGISPSCGTLVGYTLLTIRGRQLDAGSFVTVNVTATDGGSSSVPCEVVARYNDRILCLTGPSDKVMTGTISVVFDKTLRIQDGSFVFIYTLEPVLAAGQQFGSIASGGITVPVRGTGFACVGNTTMYVDRGGVRHVASDHCNPVNDTYMVCRTPKLDGPTAGALPERLRFGFRVRQADGHVFDMTPHPDNDGYMAHADPEFEDFFVSDANRLVLVNGVDLGKGYGPTDVGVVGFTDKVIPTVCHVKIITRRHIVCELALPADLNSVAVVVVNIGHQFSSQLSLRNIPVDESEFFLEVLKG